MKMFLIIPILLLCCFPIKAQEIKTLSLDINVNSVGVIKIGYESENEESALQMNLILPDNIVLDETSIKKCETLLNHNLEWRKISENQYLFFLYSLDNDIIQNGDLLEMIVKSNNQDGKYQGVIREIKTANENEILKELNSIIFNINVIIPSSIENFSIINDKSIIYNLKGIKIRDNNIYNNGIYIYNGKKIFINDYSK